MKRNLLVVGLCLLAGSSFAQKKAVKDAKSEMKSNIAEARELLKPAFTNAETMNDPETWKVAGDIEYKVFSDEKEKEQLKEFTQKGGNEESMYTGLYNMYNFYIKADSLSELPNEKGKVQNKVRKDIVKAFKDGYAYHINGGIFYNDKKEFSKAADFFERYWLLPDSKIFGLDDTASKLVEFGLVDSTYQTIKYYAIISAIQANDHKRSIRLLNKINSEPYVQNGTYKASDTYELLASEYLAVSDSASYVQTLRAGADKFPGNQYFTPNLINEFIKGNNIQGAMDYIDQAISNDSNNACDLYSVKASLYSESKDYAKAEGTYNQALQMDPNCKRALEGLGVLYILKAQDTKDKAAQAPSRKDQAALDKETIDAYQKALPFLEKYRDVLKSTNADGPDIKQALLKLQNVYYNLSLLNVDKEAELKLIDDELPKY